MRIFVTGHEGNIGRSLLGRGCFPINLDVTSFQQVRDTVLLEDPDLIIHCAAITDVGFCEDKENQELVTKTNFGAVVNLLGCDVPTIVLSSDHIFDGRRGNYKENDNPKPLNYYGMTKAAAEAACGAFDNAYVVRTSALFAKGMKDFGRYDEIMQNELRLEVPTVLYRTFAHVEHFVEGLLSFATRITNKQECPHLLNISGIENISWHEMVLSMAEMGGYNRKLIVPRRSNDKSFIPRPLNGGLNTKLARQLGIPLFSYLDGLRLIYG